MSGKNPDGYLVKQIKVTCTNCTEVMCTQSECKQLCYHMYTCDEYCYDNTNGHLCKHIHRAHSVWLKMQTNQPDYQCYESAGLDDSESDIDDPLEFAENVRNLSTGNAKRICYVHF